MKRNVQKETCRIDRKAGAWGGEKEKEEKNIIQCLRGNPPPPNGTWLTAPASVKPSVFLLMCHISLQWITWFSGVTAPKTPMSLWTWCQNGGSVPGFKTLQTLGYRFGFKKIGGRTGVRRSVWWQKLTHKTKIYRYKETDIDGKWKSNIPTHQNTKLLGLTLFKLGWPIMEM